MKSEYRAKLPEGINPKQHQMTKYKVQSKEVKV